MPRSFPDKQLAPQAFATAAFALVAAGTLIVIVGQYTDLDLAIADLYFDSQRGIFPWERTWFARNLMYRDLRAAIMSIGVVIVVAAMLDLIVPLRGMTPLRRLQLRFLALAAVLEPVLVGALQSHSSLHCPVAVDRYGGSMPYLRLLDWLPEGWTAGHCFPAGHASAGMWLSAVAIFWLPARPQRALAAFASGLAVGLLMGWVQQMRGMQFFSHTLATAWLCSALLLALLVAFRRPLLAVGNADASRIATVGHRAIGSRRDA